MGVEPFFVTVTSLCCSRWGSKAGDRRWRIGLAAGRRRDQWCMGSLAPRVRTKGHDDVDRDQARSRRAPMRYPERTTETPFSSYVKSSFPLRTM